MPELYRSTAGEEAVREWCARRLTRWPVPHSTHVVGTSLGATRLTVAGGGPTTCVYLPGTTFNAATSLGLLAALSEVSHVVCADLPGQPGGSDGRRHRDDPGAWGAWLGEVLGHVRSGRPGRLVLVGHSRGAAVALSGSPDLVDGLVLVAPAGLVPVRLSAALLVRSVAWLVRPTPRRSARVVDLMAGPSPVADRAGLVEWLTLVARHTRATGAPGPLPTDVTVRWRDRPIRVLVGEADAFFPPSRITGPATRLLGAGVEVVPGAGHLLPDQRPDRVAAAVGAVTTG